MEEQKQKQKQKQKMGRKTMIMMNKKRNIQIQLYQETIFPLLLAALCSKSNIRTALIIKKCLKRLLSLPLTHLHLPPILSLLPSLLKSNCAEVVCKSVEIIGASSLASFEMNEMVAAEDEVMKGLISLLGSSKRRVAVAACNAVLDLSTASVGRQRLIEFNAVEKLLFCFIEESIPPAATDCFNDDMKSPEDDDYAILLLQGASSLINSCTIEQLQHIPKKLSEKFSVLLKRLWGKAHKQSLCSTSSRCDQGNEFCISNIKTNSLVESIFRLSMDYDLHSELNDSEHVTKSIFDLGEASIGPFLSEIWETSPMLIKNGSKASLMKDGIFGPFIKYLGLKEAIPSFLPSMLKSTISCPAIESDELDILNIIKEIKHNLGFPIIYHQDIRVVKTQYGERELHYFQEKSESEPFAAHHILDINDIMRCEEAFKEGYSIALRGMEFRHQTISAIADELASLFGQPSAGANMYLTPSNSQGLARHSDDHCVFVCQLIGVKRWKVFPRPDFQLPRLYEPCDSLHDMEDESCCKMIDGCQQFVLKEGDVLYVPRGFPHEAIAVLDDDANLNSAGFSLHLTLAIEIEPPFEWEGFMHVALYCWDKKQKASYNKSNDSVQWALHSVSVELLHIAIKLIGNINPEFRKACLVGATSLSPDIRDGLCKNQMITFKFLISKIASESKYSGAVEHFEGALKKNEETLECMRWMKWLTVEGEEIERKPHSLSISELLIRHRDIAEAGFLQVIYKFCLEVEFQDIERQYLVLLKKYHEVRKRYTNGMLALHSALYADQ